MDIGEFKDVWNELNPDERVGIFSENEIDYLKREVFPIEYDLDEKGFMYGKLKCVEGQYGNFNGPRIVATVIYDEKELNVNEIDSMKELAHCKNAIPLVVKLHWMEELHKFTHYARII